MTETVEFDGAEVLTLALVDGSGANQKIHSRKAQVSPYAWNYWDLRFTQELRKVELPVRLTFQELMLC